MLSEYALSCIGVLYDFTLFERVEIFTKSCVNTTTPYAVSILITSLSTAKKYIKIKYNISNMKQNKKKMACRLSTLSG